MLLVQMLIGSFSVLAQNPGINFLAQLDNYNRYSNIWGYVDGTGREYALLTSDAGLSIVDITTPALPVEVAMIPGPYSGSGTLWREVKVYQNYAYVVSEHTTPNQYAGIQIIDLQNLPASASLVKTYRWPGVDSTFARAHTVSMDEANAILYISGGTATFGTGGATSGGTRIFSIADPENPVPLSFWDDYYVHDTHIRDNIAFLHNIFDGGQIDILDVSSPANPQRIHLHQYPNGFSHSSWTTPDKNYMITCNEINGLPINVWDISVLWDSDPNNNDQISQAAFIPVSPSSIAHEIYIRGDFGFISHYDEGVKLADLSDPTNPVILDTYNTANDWGVHAFFPSGNFVVSDIVEGLYVFSVSGLTAIDPIVEVPATFNLEQNFPNPFNPETTIRYGIISDSEVRLTIYNLLGQVVRTLINQQMPAGQYTARWDGRNDAGQEVSSGVYIYRLQSGSRVATRKMALLR